MGASRLVLRAAILPALALMLARCSADAGTGWVPRGATISGVITPTSSLPLAPSRAALGSSAGGRGVVLPPFTVSGTVARRGSAGLARAGAARGPRPSATPGDLLVTFRPTALGAPRLGTRTLATTAGVRAFGTAIRSRLATLVPPGAKVAGVSPAILTAKIHVADSTERDAIAAVLRRDPAVAAVTRNHLIWLDDAVATRVAQKAAVPLAVPNDPFYAFQSWHYGIIDLPRAWSLTAGKVTVLVAVVDDGIRFDHPAIAANLTSDGYDFVTDVDTLPLCAGGTITNAGDGGAYDPDPTIPGSYSTDASGTCFDPDTLGGHGLHVAGTIGAVGNDGVGVSGVNWTVRIRPVRALGVAGFGDTYDIAQGVLYAAGLPADDGAGGTVQVSTGAKIINLSLGGSGDDPTFHDAVISATNAGALVVAAAGNSGSSSPRYPAAYPEAFAVAAIGPDGAPAPYSNFGSYVDIRAPGGNFDLGDVTDGVTSTMWDFAVGSPEYAIAEGTSMATPHVSGVAALVLAQSPGLTPAELRSRLTSYAVGPATQYGAGLVNAYNSLTQTLGPPTQVYARLYSANTGAIEQTVPAQAGGAFVFSQVDVGRYFVYGGADEAGDQQVGIPGRLWGAFGAPAVPQVITVLDGGAYTASFAIGFPAQRQPNQTRATANTLMIGGYTQGTIVDALKRDFYRVTIPQAGTYTFETSGWVAACNFALEEATAIFLFNAAGTPIDSAGFVAPPPAGLNFCSRLTRALSQGTYYVAVAGAFDGGRYRLQARAGS